MADDIGWKTMALKGNVLHPKMLLQGNIQKPVQ